MWMCIPERNNILYADETLWRYDNFWHSHIRHAHGRLLYMLHDYSSRFDEASLCPRLPPLASLLWGADRCKCPLSVSVSGASLAMCLLSSFVLLCAMQDGGTQKRLVHFNDTSITTVTVFATGAEVTRLVPLEAPVVGNMTIVLVGLPAQLDEGSVRITADAETLHVREVSEEQHDGKPDSSEAATERVAGARSELNAAQANKTRIQFQRTNLELYLKARLVTGSGASTISASDAAESLDFYEAIQP